MNAHNSAVPERLAELVVALSGTDDRTARVALYDARDRQATFGDDLTSVAAALVTIRHRKNQPRESVATGG